MSTVRQRLFVAGWCQLHIFWLWRGQVIEPSNSYDAFLMPLDATTNWQKNNLGTSELWWKTEVWRCMRDDRHRLDGCYTWKLRSGKEVHWMQGLYLSNSISSDIFQLCINKIWNQKSIHTTFWILFWLVMIWDYKKHPHPIDWVKPWVKRQIFECNILFVENLAYCE